MSIGYTAVVLGLGNIVLGLTMIAGDFGYHFKSLPVTAVAVVFFLCISLPLMWVAACGFRASSAAARQKRLTPAAPQPDLQMGPLTLRKSPPLPRIEL